MRKFLSRDAIYSGLQKFVRLCAQENRTACWEKRGLVPGEQSAYPAVVLAKEEAMDTCLPVFQFKAKVVLANAIDKIYKQGRMSLNLSGYFLLLKVPKRGNLAMYY